MCDAQLYTLLTDTPNIFNHKGNFWLYSKILVENLLSFYLKTILESFNTFVDVIHGKNANKC